MNQEPYQRVITIVVEILRVDPADIGPETHFIDDLGASSMDLIEMLSMAEYTFGRTIPDDRIAEFSTIAKVVDFFDAA